MGWFTPVSSPAGLKREDSRRSNRLGQSSGRSSENGSAADPALNSAQERYINAVRHPDSVTIDSSGPFSSRGSRRWSTRITLAPDTSSQRLGSQSDQREKQEARGPSADPSSSLESPAQLRVPTERFAMSPKTPLKRDSDGATSANALQQQPWSETSSTTQSRPQISGRSAIEINQNQLLHFGGQHRGRDMPGDDPSAGPTQTPLHPPKAAHNDLGSAAQIFFNPDAGSLELAQTRHDRQSDGQWSHVGQGEIRKPRPIAEKMSESKSRQSGVRNHAASMDIKLQPAGLTRDPYLYDNIGAKMRQMTVDLWLLRTKVAEYVKDWKAMENYGRQAHKLAGDLRWEPFVAQCALPIGIALFNQGEWFGAYENFEEAEKTQGYYLAPETISVWQRLAAVKADCSAQRPSVPALASNPTPASISKESRLYDPGRRLTPSPRMRAKNALSKTAPNVPESDPIAPTAPPLETYHQNPISPTSSESASPPPRAENELALLSANYDRQSLTELPPTSESEATFLEISPRVPTTTCISHPNLPTQDTTAPPAPPIFPRPPPGSQTLVPTPPPPNPQSPGPHAPKAPASPTSHRSAIQAWESAQVESEINTITDTASPLVRSAGSAILHWPRPPSRSIVQRPRSRRGSIYTKRPGFGRAISDGGVPVTRERPDRPRSWGPVGGAPPSLSQGSTPLAEGRGNSAVPDIPARTNPSIKWADEYTKPVVVARREQSVGGKAEEGSKQDRASEHEEGSEKGGSEHEAGREKESEHSGGDGDDRSETSNSEEGGVKLEDGKSDV